MSFRMLSHYICETTERLNAPHLKEKEWRSERYSYNIMKPVSDEAEAGSTFSAAKPASFSTTNRTWGQFVIC